MRRPLATLHPLRPLYPLRLAALSALACVALACAGAGPRPAAGAGAVAAATPAVAGPSPWWNGAVFYEVFVRSFQDTNGDGKGDLAGLISRLDYLNDGDPATTSDLGVDALWLMPIFASPSYHGYDATDFLSVNPDYGTSADLDRLVAEAHRRGMKVVLDLMLNHTSTLHPWFQASTRGGEKRDWYVWSETDLGWGQPWNPNGRTWHKRNGAWYYALFWEGMPDLNYRTPAVREEAKRIARYWLARGVDGFRLDAVKHLVETGPGPGQAGNPETHAFLKEFAAAVKAAKPDAVLVGEVWSETAEIAPYFGRGGDELDVLFDFPLAAAVVEAARTGDAGKVAAKLAENAATYPPGAVTAPFLTNHDMQRVATQLGSDAAKLRVAASLFLTLPGAPFVWQGEELGMQNGPSGDDEWKRTPMAWDASPGGGFTTAARPWQPFSPGKETANVAAQAGDPGSLLARYRALVRARHASAALQRGDLRPVPAGPGVLAFLRRTGDETVLVAHNLGAEPATLEVAAPAGSGTPEPLFADPGAAASPVPGGTRLVLPPRASGAWRLR